MTREEVVNSMSLQDAIQVLKDTNCYGTMDIAKTVILKALDQEPCTDAINRQAVLEKAIYAPIARVVTEDKVIYRKIVFVDEIENIPPVNPAEKVGQWEYNPLDMCFQCSQCKCCCEDDYKEPPKYKYCPQCGAKMEEVTG